MGFKGYKDQKGIDWITINMSFDVLRTPLGILKILLSVSYSFRAENDALYGKLHFLRSASEMAREPTSAAATPGATRMKLQIPCKSL